MIQAQAAPAPPHPFAPAAASTEPPPPRLRARFHPESGAGGFSAIDGTVIFYVRVAALLRPEATVLDLGAGRGRAHLDDPVSFRRALMDLRGRCARVIGADPDPAVRDNPSLDEARVMPTPEHVPLPDASVDLILADHVLEHVADPVAFAAECARLLRPGGWLCARTPNRWGLVAMASRAIPERLHAAALARAQPHRREEDVFPTCYRLNTRRALARAFPAPAWAHHVHGWNSEPAYAGRSALAWRAMRGLQAALPSAMDANLHVFLRRAATHPAAAREGPQGGAGRVGRDRAAGAPGRTAPTDQPISSVSSTGP